MTPHTNPMPNDTLATPAVPGNLRRVSEPRRFVPTLTDVVEVPVVASVSLDNGDFSAATQPEAVPLPAPITPQWDPDALVARACATVTQGLDDHIRAVVADAMQTQHMLLVQSLRGQLQPLVEAMVRDAVEGEMARLARQSGESCIQATD